MTVNSQKGFTLVELMIGMAISLIIMAGAVYVFTKITQVSLYEIRAVRAMDQARDVMQRMSRDIRRAGYQGHNNMWNSPEAENLFDTNLSGALKSEFSAIENETFIHVSDDKSCVLFSYNHDDDSDVINEENLFGYKLEGQQIKTLEGVDEDGANFRCDASGTHWESITYLDVLAISSASFTLDENCVDTVSGGVCTDSESAVTLRSMTIAITAFSKKTGSDADENKIQIELSETVDLPNVGMFMK